MEVPYKGNYNIGTKQWPLGRYWEMAVIKEFTVYTLLRDAHIHNENIRRTLLRLK